MPAHIDSMAYVGETPWHKLGIKLDAPPSTVAAMIAACGLGWGVTKESLFLANGRQVEDRFAITRDSDGSILGTVGPTYRPVQNVDAFSFFEPFIASGACRFETGGALLGGSRVWMLAELDRAPSVVVPGDEVRKYLLLANGHDGSMALRVGFTPIRVVCNNTLGMAVTSAASRLMSIRHTNSATAALADVREIINLVDGSFEATADKYRALAAKGVTTDSLREYLKIVFPPPKVSARKDIADKSRAAKAATPKNLLDEILDETVVTPTLDSLLAAADVKKALANGANGHRPDISLEEILTETEDDGNRRAIATCLDLFDSKSNALPGVRGTLWAAYNAVTEYTSHVRGRNEENRANALLGGEGSAINARALAAAVKLASN